MSAPQQGVSAPSEPPKLLHFVSVSDVFQKPASPPLFVWDDYLPRGVVTLMGAHGGTGKSTIALMLATVATLGYPLFGIKTVACKTLFVSLEDSPRIVRYRLAAICRALNVDPIFLGDRLHVVDGTEHPELYSAKGRDEGFTTATYEELSTLVNSYEVGLVVVDNASDAYGADEIQRRQVRAFIRTLTLLARLTDCAVLLLSHVDKNTSRNGKANGGEGYSGSTAWHNSVRSRLFLSRADNGTLTLEHQKANLGKKREPLFLEWLDDGFPQLKSGNVKRDGNVAGAADHEHAIALLKLIAEFESREKYCSPAPSARTNPYALLKSEPSFKQLNLGSDDTKRIVTMCDRNKWLATVKYHSVDRKPRQRWTVTPEGQAIAGLVALTALTAPTCHGSAQDALSVGGAPTAPTGAGGMGEGSAQNIEDVSAPGAWANCLTAPSQSVVVDGQITPRTSHSDLEPSANQEQRANP